MALSTQQAKDTLQREEISTFSPFGQYRERSTQRVVYNHLTPYLASEFEFKHATFKDFQGTAPTLNLLYQASFRGYNMDTPLEFKAGRIWTGNQRFRPVDGVSWSYPWGKRLTTRLEFGQLPRIEDRDRYNQPAYFEGRLHYRFNDEAFFAVQGIQDDRDHFTSTMVGYQIDTLKFIGEYQSSGATDSARVSLQYYDGKRLDLTGDYRISRHEGTDTGIMRNLLGWEIGTCYFEGGVGGKFHFDGPRLPSSSFYEGNLTWGLPKKGKDTMSLGYMLETSPGSSSRTLSGLAERNISSNTRLSLEAASTRFDSGRNSVQNLETRLHRKVDWGYFEVLFGVITASDIDDLQKEVRLRAGYEF
jgi:hypothetical protein